MSTQKSRFQFFAAACVLAPLVFVLAAEAEVPAEDVATVQQRSIAAWKESVDRAYAGKDSADALEPISPLVHFEPVNPLEPAGDHLSQARRLAAAVVAQDRPAPQLIVDVGSFTGEFLEAFLQRFPSAQGQWTEPVTINESVARTRLARFGTKVSYVIGCPARDISTGCVPKDVDVLMTSWLSIHQNHDGIQKFYSEAGKLLPHGGWVAVIDHVNDGGEDWHHTFLKVREELASSGTVAVVEGPPAHHENFRPASVQEHMNALRAAGFEDGQLVWRRLDTALIMAKRR